MTPPVEPRPNCDACRAFEHIDLFIVEGIAVIAAEVAHAVEKDVVLRSEAANGQIVALQRALTGRETDAWRIAQRIAQRGDTLDRQEAARESP